ncbi:MULTISPECIES: Hsp70 family protein [unclassified Mycolicibacterium]|uniref:Hsp70 family protein n=1 Tax=unclassified Mycolicibacterium TaxID=2636767 RepID=UPI0012DF17CC|nr:MULTISPECIES: Hsp70 family protein [unclassified Mycolicibacterium]MUL83738.1 Hsp70 family protein [Mycolicibacterium sp. CBMA 329]MUL90729.1 Hsp70 family protein [Mycolicibacterium sp. CBMA 331]MUM00697.1 Hsp70 family protein [Mycolicibacterium sp. CBMA 334]MUM29768.1 Hsp70 family protein [Mycolicibacterium sp. CBMA 295]MUM41673.1 Hsp70 family protein [Mycolicibacterium sp. CBMA 247]
MADGIGLSIGSTNLRAVVVGRTAVTRSPVLTLYPHRAAEVGVPGENPNLNERGLILTDFVDRVGDPVGMLAPDGSTHRGEALLAEALGALLRTLTGGRPPADPVAVTYPAHWRTNQVEALRTALAAIGDFGDPVLAPDAVAALIALQDNPGVPTRGVIALCDFGGSGTSITLADAGNGYQPIAPAIRHTDLSGDLIDQGLLTHVVNDLSAAGTVDLASTSAIGSLGRLRGECRRAKERLSTESVTALVAELPGHRSDVRLNRNELDDVIAEPLAEFMSVLQDAIGRSGVRPGELVAVASIGGGARIPAITTSLSEHLRVPVITAAQPELSPAIGGGLTAVRGTAVEGATALAPASAPAPPTAAAAMVAPEPPAAPQALAWSDAQDVPDVAPVDDYRADGYGAGDYSADFDTGFEPAGGRTAARPQLEFGERELTERDEIEALPWYRRPPVILGAGAAAVLVAVVAVLLTITRGDEPTVPASTSKAVTSTTVGPEEPAPAAPVDEPAPARAPRTVTEEAPAPQTVTQTVQEPAPEAPPVTENPPPAETPTPTPTPAPTTEAPAPTTTDAPPTTTQAPTTTHAPWSPTAPYPTIPGLPWVPAPGGGHTGG